MEKAFGSFRVRCTKGCTDVYPTAEDAARMWNGSGEDWLERITPEMIEAGVSVLWETIPFQEQLESDRLLVEEIFRAMEMAAGPHGLQRRLPG